MDIRSAFLDYFKKNGHLVTPSAGLVPDDPTLLFTNAGMVPFKKIFTGEAPIPNPPRAASCQTCLRAGGKHNDLENVGYTARHHTFFEMLGNFSFGDYFKQEAIDYAWEFVTKVLELPREKLWVTVHENDDEAQDLWSRHVKKERIVKMGDKDNFWQMGDTGPCGPCSEIYVDQGAEHFRGPEDYLGGDGDRFLEIWNLVFMQYNRDENGVLYPLPKPSIDTGMGLERITAIKEGVYSNYDSSLFMPIIRHIEELVKKPYIYERGASYRVIADHIRAVTFLLAQGVNFDREGRGYVLRRILRRAVRHGYLLGRQEPFMYTLVDSVAALMGDHYEYLRQKQEAVKAQIKLEEERFFATIAAGIELFDKELQNTREIFSGEVAFRLYDTFGFPLDLTQDMLREKGLKLDTAGFEQLMQQQRERAKAAWKGSGDLETHGDFKMLIEKFGTNTFVGYTMTQTLATVLAILDEEFKSVFSLDAGQQGWVFLDKTPFYAESGGQAGDTGSLASVGRVMQTRKFFDLNLSLVEMTAPLSVGDQVMAVVDEKKRREIAKHHSATHLLHAALREILGDHVAQAGSLVEEDRLRFDFSHPKALSPQELEKIEDWVNERIARDIPSEVEECSLQEAKQRGAMALFGEKYGQNVRMVSFGSDSIELCGGTHVKSTAQIGSFYILKESGVSAGVRRIEAVCGLSAIEYAKELRHTLAQAVEEVKNRDLMVGIAKLKEQITKLRGEITALQKAAKTELASVKIGATTVIVQKIEGGDIKALIDEIKNKEKSVAIMLFLANDSKVTIAAGSKNAPLKAGEWVKKVAPVLGGGGGGRDDFAQAGGKDASKIAEAIEIALSYAKEKLQG